MIWSHQLKIEACPRTRIRL